MLAAVTLHLFLPAARGQFLNYDDPLYVTENPIVRTGLHWQGMRWSLTTIHAANWHPLTWLSHMLDVTLFGLSPRGHHLTSILLHTVNGVLLLLVIRSLTAHLWPAAVVAALFALHPLRVESVAWVAERKDVLSALLWLLTTAAYVGYVRRRTAGRYAATLVLYALGLAAKPMLVSLPLVLLVLDFWPLGRLRPTAGLWLRARQLLLEKIPLFVLASAASAATLVAQAMGEAMQLMQGVGFPVRLGNAFLSLWAYLGKSLWPAAITVFYPHPQGTLPVATTSAAAFALAVLSAIVFRQARDRPFLLAGWAWYLVTLTPVLGLVQVGAQAMANRYTYLPMIGPVIALVWLARDGFGRMAGCRLSGAVASSVMMIAFSLLTHRELEYWRDSVTLFSRAKAVTEGRSWIVHSTLAKALRLEGDLLGAEQEYRHAISLYPRYAETHNNLGVLLNQRRRADLALGSLAEAVRLNPDYGDAHFNLATTLESLGRVQEAIVHYREALRIRPDDAMAAARLSYAITLLGERP